MILGKKWIKLAMKLGWIVCKPAPSVITEVSFNVRLGDNIWKLKPELDSREGFVNPENPASEQYLLTVVDDWFWMEPGKCYIGHTEEYCGSTVPFITSSMRTRSTFRRWGLDIAMAAGMGEPGFHSRWALELHNSHHLPVLVCPGWEVGQLSFQWCMGATNYTRAYNAPENEWTPEVLLPKAMVKYE